MTKAQKIMERRRLTEAEVARAILYNNGNIRLIAQELNVTLMEAKELVSSVPERKI